jgi:hypothetical protein
MARAGVDKRARGPETPVTRHLTVLLAAVIVLPAGCASEQQAQEAITEQVDAGAAGAGGPSENIAAGTVFGANLTGDAVAPEPGDPEGLGQASVDLTQAGQVCFQLAVEGIDPATGAHIHQGAEGEAGDIVVELEAPSEGSANGCVEAGDDVITAIADNPSDYYVNVHNDEHPDGAVRGQLGPPSP